MVCNAATVEKRSPQLHPGASLRSCTFFIKVMGYIRHGLARNDIKSFNIGSGTSTDVKQNYKTKSELNNNHILILLVRGQKGIS
jgi:hypothetical protein